MLVFTSLLTSTASGELKSFANIRPSVNIPDTYEGGLNVFSVTQIEQTWPGLGKAKSIKGLPVGLIGRKRQLVQEIAKIKPAEQAFIQGG